MEFGPYWPVGTKVRFLGVHGYPHQLKEAKEVFSIGQELTVKSSETFSSSSDVTFEEVKGIWNTVMFREQWEVSIIYDDKCGEVVPDAQIDTKVTLSGRDEEVCIGSEMMLMGFRVAHKRGILKIKKIYFQQHDIFATVDENGRLSEYPESKLDDYLNTLAGWDE